MKHRRINSLAILLILIEILLVSCSTSKLETSSTSKLETSIGNLSISRVEMLAEFANQKPKNAADKILMIYFENIENLTAESFREASRDVIVVDKHGNEYTIAISGIHQKEFFLAYITPGSTTDFSLHWPYNKPIPLEIAEQ